MSTQIDIATLRIKLNNLQTALENRVYGGNINLYVSGANPANPPPGLTGSVINITGSNGIILSSSVVNNTSTLFISQSSAIASLNYFGESATSYTAGQGNPTEANDLTATRNAVSNVHIRLVPKGTGGLLLGPATGQARGAYSIDLSINPNVNFSHGARATYSTIGGGGGNQYITTDGVYSTIAGGRNCTSTAPYSMIPGGYNSSDKYSTGKFAFASNNFDYSTGIIVYRGITTDGSTTVSLTVDGQTPYQGTFSPTVPANILTAYLGVSALKVRAEIVARDSDGLAQAWTLQALIKGETYGLGSVVGQTVETFGTDFSTATVNFATNGNAGVGNGIFINVVGVASKTIRWAATIYSTEVSFVQ